MRLLKVISGRVMSGQKRGAKMGFPTINIEGEFDLEFGVYAAKVFWADKSYMAAMHYGPNITFKSDFPILEVHLLDFSGDLYNETVKIEVYNKLRETRKFKNSAELSAQIEKDIQQIKQLCSNM